MARKSATLGSVLIAQDFLPEHWNWANTDLATLGDIEKMGNVIKTRLENGGCKISEMYAVKHDKDESKLWNEYTMTYDVKFTTNHAHFLIKFSEGKTLEEIAPLVGVEPQFIEKPHRGRYSYDNSLAYMIHIKYDNKYQYDPHDVATIVGKKYIEYYRERYEAWTRGRAERKMNDMKNTLNFLKVGIAKGEITLEDIILNEDYRVAYILYNDQIKKVFESKASADSLLTGLQNRQERGDDDE